MSRTQATSKLITGLALATAAIGTQGAYIRTGNSTTVTAGTDPCTGDSDCDGSEICVDVNANWAQCVDCTNFEYACPFWDADLLAAASEACVMNCPGVQCTDDLPCYGSKVDCVPKADNTWSQCVDCHTSQFEEDCQKLDTDMRAAAVLDCGKNCPNTMCTADDSGMQCVDDYTCVIQADGGWSQCIDCTDKSQFKTDCSSWSETFQEAAEAACGYNCPSAAPIAGNATMATAGTDPCTGDSDCDGSEICVDVNANWAQCVDCTNFEYACPFWDADLLAAASEACVMNCPGVQCTDDLPCYGSKVDCVPKADNTWSQCVDCHTSQFEEDCQKLDTDMRAAAVLDCGKNCPNTMCTADDSGMQCVDDYTCVIQADGGWSQCIDCTDKSQFKTDCSSWSETFQEAAEAACGYNCPSAAPIA